MNTAAPTDRANAWVLNLDAELELMRPQNYHPSKASLAACSRWSEPARSLLQPGDLELSRAERLSIGCARGYRGRAWCPTPSVVALLDRVGAPIERAPTLACLQAVNHRSFHAQLGQTLTDATFSTQLDAALKRLSCPSPNGWVVKRGFGFAGRGVRRMPARLTEDDVRWLTHAFAYGGVQIEPWVELIAEYSLHGYISTGTVRFGQPCRLVPGAQPSYVQVAKQQDPDADYALRPHERSSLFQHAELVAHALQSAGYFGPFGIDAFVYRFDGNREFNPRSEVNARYTLAYPVGMAPSSS